MTSSRKPQPEQKISVDKNAIAYLPITFKNTSALVNAHKKAGTNCTGLYQEPSAIKPTAFR